MSGNKNLDESAYSSELEKYMDEQDNSGNDLDFEDESNFQAENIGSSKLDDYLGLDNQKEDENEEINYCIVCGKKLKKFNYGDKCDDCVRKIELVHVINQLLDYTSPSEELDRNVLLNAGFDELKLNIIISNLLNEHLIILSSKGIYLAGVKTLNEFFKIYGSDSDILDESLYKTTMFSDGFIDIGKYSDLVKVRFDSRKDKWEVNFYRDGNRILRKYFVNILDANSHATNYLRDVVDFNEIRDEKPIEPQEVKYKRSKHEFVFFSMKRNKWYVKVKGHVRSKFVGFYDTEEEAVIARDDYIQKKRANQAKLRPNFAKNESDAIVSFHERSNQWVVKVKNKKGRFKKLGYYDTEEEAIAAKNEYYGIDNELKSDFDPVFSKGDKVQVISGMFESDFGVIKGFLEERDSFIVKLENSDVSLPVLIKADQLKLL